MDDELRDFHFDINIKGSWNVTKACLPYMKNRNASIVNLSSVTGPMVADPGEVAYAATKGANLGFTKALARELVDYNIRVNAVLPGMIKTDRWEKNPDFYADMKKIVPPQDYMPNKEKINYVKECL